MEIKGWPAFTFDLLTASMIKINICGKGFVTNLDKSLACFQIHEIIGNALRLN